MRLSQILAVLVLLPALALAQGDPPADKKVEEPKGLLEVGTILTVRVNGTVVSFNQGRRYVISVNEHLANARDARARLAQTLKRNKELDQVVFDWIGRVPPKELNLKIGDKIPVSIAQAVIAAYATDSKIPVRITLMTTDPFHLGYNYRVYVGSLTNCDTDPLKPKQIQELLKSDLTAEQFAKLLRKE